jgi:ankyrin repeat protein
VPEFAKHTKVMASMQVYPQLALCVVRLCRRRLGEVAFEGGVWTPLGFACRLGQLDLVRLLLSKGADVEQECKGLISNDAR